MSGQPGMMGINGQSPAMGMTPPGLQNGNVQQSLPPGFPQMMPPQAQGVPQYGQPAPRQAMGGPMGPPMSDPNSAGGFFGHPNHGGMPRPGFPYQQ